MAPVSDGVLDADAVAEEDPLSDPLSVALVLAGQTSTDVPINQM